MIELPDGFDIFSSSAATIVNPVNCVGVMGKGLALEFKTRFPANFSLYRQACQQAQSDPRSLLGAVIAWQAPSGQWILNAPTKLHWRDPSELEYVRSAMLAIDRFCVDRSLQSCCLPALGSGLGGLDWQTQALPAILEATRESPVMYSVIPPRLSPRQAPGYPRR